MYAHPPLLITPPPHTHTHIRTHTCQMDNFENVFVFCQQPPFLLAHSKADSAMFVLLIGPGREIVP